MNRAADPLAWLVLEGVFVTALLLGLAVLPPARRLLARWCPAAVARLDRALWGHR